MEGLHDIQEGFWGGEKKKSESPWSKGVNSQLSSSPVTHSLLSKTKEGLCWISGWGVATNPLTTESPAVCPATQIQLYWGGLFVSVPPSPCFGMRGPL